MPKMLHQIIWVFDQTELDSDWKRFSMNFSVAFFYHFKQQ